MSTKIVAFVFWIVALVALVQTVILQLRLGSTATPTLLADVQVPLWVIAALIAERSK